MSDLYDGIIGTIGIELETELMHEQFQIPGWIGTHDASIEMPVVMVRGKNTHYYVVRTPDNIGITRLLRGERRILGREFVSSVFMEDVELRSSVGNAVSFLQSAGERTRNKRAGLHIHVGWSYDLRILKRTINMIAWTESLLFHLGGMGYKFRGADNNSAYCRPLTLYGPPIVSTNIGNVQMTNIEALLEAPTLKSFWNRFGGINIQNLPKRYTPQRYMAVNLASIFFHKTLEFRMFNTTLNKDYILAIANLCKELTLFTMSNSKFPDEENSVYSVCDRRVNHNILTKICELIELDNTTEATLREIIERSPVPKLDGVYVLSHLEDRSVHFDNYDISGVQQYYPQIGDFIRPGIVDIHTMENDISAAFNRLDDPGAGPRMLRRATSPFQRTGNPFADPDEAPDGEDFTIEDPLDEDDVDDMTDEELETAREEARAAIESVQAERTERVRVEMERQRFLRQQQLDEIRDRVTAQPQATGVWTFNTTNAADQGWSTTVINTPNNPDSTGGQ